MNDRIEKQFGSPERPARAPLHVQLGCKPFGEQLRVCVWILVGAGVLLFALLAASESGRALLVEAIQNALK